MRLICPNCDANYEVEATILPLEGRDLECSACGQVWFQKPPAIEGGQSRTAGLIEGAKPRIQEAETVGSTTQNTNRDQRAVAAPVMTEEMRQIFQEEAARTAKIRGNSPPPALSLKPEQGSEIEEKPTARADPFAGIDDLEWLAKIRQDMERLADQEEGINVKDKELPINSDETATAIPTDAPVMASPKIDVTQPDAKFALPDSKDEKISVAAPVATISSPEDPPAKVPKAQEHKDVNPDQVPDVVPAAAPDVVKDKSTDPVHKTTPPSRDVPAKAQTDRAVSSVDRGSDKPASSRFGTGFLAASALAGTFAGAYFYQEELSVKAPQAAPYLHQWVNVVDQGRIWAEQTVEKIMIAVNQTE